jgi:protein-S-isoprenylcysteine O-methyltransferase Ste14
MLILGAFLLIRSPALLEKRLNGKEKESTQRGVIALSGLMFPIGFVLCALDFRFGWSCVPVWAVIVASVSFLLGYVGYAEVMRENAYLSRTVEVQEGQTVIDTGLYGIVRHPMYSATVVLFLSMPLVLGSTPAFAIMLVYLPIIAKRIKNEEQVLRAGLEGYEEYTHRVKWRLVPHVW